MSLKCSLRNLTALSFHCLFKLQYKINLLTYIICKHVQPPLHFYSTFVYFFYIYISLKCSLSKIPFITISYSAILISFSHFTKHYETFQPPLVSPITQLLSFPIAFLVYQHHSACVLYCYCFDWQHSPFSMSVCSYLAGSLLNYCWLFVFKLFLFVFKII